MKTPILFSYDALDIEEEISIMTVMNLVGVEPLRPLLVWLIYQQSL